MFQVAFDAQNGSVGEDGVPGRDASRPDDAPPALLAQGPLRARRTLHRQRLPGGIQVSAAGVRHTLTPTLVKRVLIRLYLFQPGTQMAGFYLFSLRGARSLAPE